MSRSPRERPQRSRLPLWVKAWCGCECNNQRTTIPRRTPTLRPHQRSTTYCMHRRRRSTAVDRRLLYGVQSSHRQRMATDGACGTVWDRLGPRGTTWDHIGPHGTRGTNAIRAISTYGKCISTYGKFQQPVGPRGTSGTTRVRRDQPGPSVTDGHRRARALCVW